MTKWREFKLEDVATVQTGPFGSQLHQRDYVENGTPIITVEHLGDNRITYQNLPKVTDEDKERLVRYHLQEGDVVFSRVGSVDRRALVTKKEDGWLFSGRCLRVRANEKLANGAFLSYYFGQENFKEYIRRIAVGATMPSINTKILSEIIIKIPDLPTQTAIAEILSSLDDKIELNNKINQELENLAQTLFKRWFVDFEFPNENGEPYKSSGGELVDSELGEIPKGWEVIPIGQLFEFVIGGDWGKEEADEEHSSMNYVIRGTDIPTLKGGVKTSIPHRAIKPSKLLKRQIQESDIIIEISGGSTEQPTGRTIFISKEILDRLEKRAIPASFCRLIRPKIGYAEFVATYLTKIYEEGKTWEYQNQSTGISNFQFGFFESSELLALPKDKIIIENFSKLISDVYNLMTTNENIQLMLIRDTLLPKLISGELEVS